MAIRITYFNVWWDIVGNPINGSFVDGTPWAVGPIQITDMSPKAEISATETTVLSNGSSVPREKHGSMINPTWAGPQGWSNDYTTGAMSYSRALNVGLPGGNQVSPTNPLNVPVNSSLITMRSQVSAAQSTRPKFLDAGILTVLSAPPPAGSFRPTYHGTNKTIKWNTSQMDFSVLQNHAPVGNTPQLSEIETIVERFNVRMGGPTGSDSRLACAINNQSSYASSKAANLTLALNSMHLNHPVAALNYYERGVKNWSAIRLVQMGIDEYEGLVAGRIRQGLGGHSLGDLGVLMMAAKVLNDPAILAWCNYELHPAVLGEMAQIWTVQQSDVGRPVDEPTGSYIQADVGIGEWGEQHTRNQNRDSRYWTYTTTPNGGVRYRNICWDNVVGTAMFIRRIGGRTDCHHQAFFDYADRVMSSEYEGDKIPTTNRKTFSDSAYQGIGAFNHAFHQAYRSYGDASGGEPVDPAVVLPTISPDVRAFLGAVTVSMSVSYPPEATIRYTTDGSAPTNTSPLYTGPFQIVGATTQIRAKGFAPGYNDSSIASALFTYRSMTSVNEWVAVPTTTQSGSAVETTFLVTPGFTGLDGVVGLTAVASADAYSELAYIVQFATDGFVRVRNGSAYQSLTPFAYQAGVQYRVDMVVNTIAKTYSVTITPVGGSPVVIATNYAIRTEQASSSGQIEYFVSYTLGSTMALEDIWVGDFTPPTPTVPSCVILPSSGPYLNSVEISITNSLAGAEIRYTLDGSDPTGSSPIYTGSFVRTSTTTVKAIALKADYNTSPVSAGFFEINAFTAGNEVDGFTNIAIGERFADVEVTVVATPSHANTDAVIGLSSPLVDGFSDFATAARFNSSGEIDARNGGAYSAENTLSYSAGVAYTIVFTVNQALKTYSVTVTPAGGSPVVVASNYAFRTEQANISTISYLAAAISALASDTHTLSVTGIAVENVDLSPPPVKILRRYVNARRRR